MTTEITKEELNTVVRSLAKVSRPAAVEILAKFGALNTVQLKTEDWRAVFDACTKALKK